jgi:NADH-quinone oxidoreductase subunit J
MAEVILFLIVGAVAIIAATLMLLSQNAVHSALFLILNFVCVAFLYLLLEAPFLAMVQIAVYAGAIMVLFLFVIMLLGAERTPVGSNIRRFRWLAPVALGLSLAFIISVAWALSAGRIDTVQPPPGQALVRFVHAAPAQFPEAGANDIQAAIAERRFDLYVEEELLIPNFAFNPNVETPRFVDLEPGTYNITLSPAGTTAPLFTDTLTVGADEVVTVVLSGSTLETLTLTPVQKDLTPVERGTGRVVLFNAYDALTSISLVNIRSELFADSRQVIPVIPDLPYGTASEPVTYPVGDPNWVVVEGGRTGDVQQGNQNPILLRVSNVPNIAVAPNTSHLFIFAAERRFDGSVIPVVIDLVDEAQPVFGSPQAIGRVLFTDYVLPVQLVAVLLLAAMIGVIVLTHREPAAPKPSRSQRRKVSRPLTSVISSQVGSDLATSPAPRLPEPEDDEQREPAGD